MPASSAWARSTRAHRPWMVEIQADSTAASASSISSSRSRTRIRRFSSSAARSVNVITSRWSSGVPSCSRRTTRSISTDVLPVPAPAETNTRPRRSIASACPRFQVRVAITSPPGRCRRPGAGTTRGSCPRSDRAAPRPTGSGPRSRWRSRPRGRPAPRTARAAAVVGHHALDLALDRHPAHLALAAQRAVQAGHRLDPEHVAGDQDVQRQLQLALGLDLLGRSGALAGLVVPDRAPRRHAGVAVDPVDGAGHGEAVQPQALLQVRLRRLGAEPHLVVARHQRRVERRLAGQEALQVALQPADLSPAGHARAGCGRRPASPEGSGASAPPRRAAPARSGARRPARWASARGTCAAWRARPSRSPWARTGSRSRPAAGTARRTRPTSTPRTSRARSPRTAPARPAPPAPPRFAAAGAAGRRGEPAPACASSRDGRRPPPPSRAASAARVPARAGAHARWAPAPAGG